MQWFGSVIFWLSLLPILSALTLILLFRMSAIQSGVISLALAASIALLVPAFDMPMWSVARALLQGSVNTIGLAYVLLGGVFLYQVLRAGGSLARVSDWIHYLLPHPTHQIFVIVFGVSVFFESTTGFGVGIIVTAPLLIALGYDPIRAAVLALIGQCAVSWGALAVGTVLGAELSGINAGRIGMLAAVFSFPYLVASGIVAAIVSGQHRPRMFCLRWLFIYTTVLSLVLAAVSRWPGVELAGCIAGLAVICLGVLVNRRDRRASNGVPASIKRGTVRSIFPLVALLAGLLLSRLIPSLQRYLKSTWTIEWPAWNFQLAPLYHPGSLLLLSALLGLLVLPEAGRVWWKLTNAAIVQWSKAAIAVLGFLALGQLMQDAGMTTRIANTIVSAAGGYYAAVVPVIGGIGGFITASNAASNALFMNLQMSAADQLGFSKDLIATAQNVSGSNMTLASPGRLVFAASLSGIAGGESELMKRVLPLALIGLASIMLMSHLANLSNQITTS